MNWTTRCAIIAITITVCISTCGAGVRSSIKAGNAAYKQNDYDGALKHYRDAEIADPNNPVVHFNLGDALYQSGKGEDAHNEFTKALASKDPRVRARAYYNLGNTAYRNEKTDEAVEYYKKALMINPHDQDAKYNLEYLSMVKNQPQKKKQNKKNDKDKKDKDKDKQKQQGTGDQDKQEQKKGGMSKEDAKRILQTYDDADKNSLKKRRAAQPPMPKTDEDW